MLKVGGKLYVSFSMGKDLFVWNMGRRYSEKTALSMLEIGNMWEIFERWGWEEKKASFEHPIQKMYSPIWVLTKKNT